jgi:endoglucanase
MMYAGAAARAAFLLADLDAERAAGYEASAILAMEWAESQPIPDWHDTVEEVRSWASAELYRATGEERFHDAFRETTPFADGVQDQLGCRGVGPCDAGFVYARTDHAGVDADLRQTVIDSFEAHGHRVVETTTGTTAFEWAQDNQWFPETWGMAPSVPNAVGLVRAHALTGEPLFLDAAIRAGAFALGGNPQDMTFMTGLGHECPRNPLIVDMRNGGVAPWPGVTLFGIHDLGRLEPDNWMLVYFIGPAGTHPAPRADTWPAVESFFDMFTVPPFSEFTMQSTIANATYVYGYLAASPR